MPDIEKGNAPPLRFIDAQFIPQRPLLQALEIIGPVYDDLNAEAKRPDTSPPPTPRPSLRPGQCPHCLEYLTDGGHGDCEPEPPPAADTRHLEPQPDPYFAPGDTFTFSVSPPKATPPPRRIFPRHHAALHSLFALSLLTLPRK